jgi:hypothetical protein
LFRTIKIMKITKHKSRNSHRLCIPWDRRNDWSRSFFANGTNSGVVGDLFPIAFIAGAIVVAFSPYSYVKFSNAYPSSGGVQVLDKAYGPGTASGSFSLMYVFNGGCRRV